MFKRPVSWGGTLLFLIISFAPLAFSALVIRFYALNERTNILHNRLRNSSEQASLLLKKYVSGDILKGTKTLAASYDGFLKYPFGADKQTYLLKQWLQNSVFSGLILSDNADKKKIVTNPSQYADGVSKNAIAFGYRLADSLADAVRDDGFLCLIHTFPPDTIPYFFSGVQMDSTRSIVSFTRGAVLHELFINLAANNVIALFLTDRNGMVECGDFNVFDYVPSQNITNYVRRYLKTHAPPFERTIVEGPPGSGKKYLFLFKYEPRLNKVIVAVSPAVPVIAVLKSLNFETILLFILTLLLAVFANYYAYTRIVRPVRRLTLAAEKVAAGDFNIRVPKTYNDEIGNLTWVFNKSIKQIHTFNQINIDKIIVERKKLEHIIEQLAAGILIVDPENTIIICNKIFAGWYRLNVNAIVGKKLSAVKELTDYIQMIEKLSWEKSSEVKQRKITLGQQGTREERILDASASNIFTSGKTFLATSIYVRDITREHEVDKLKSELISTVAHELRSPLVSIIGFSEMLLTESEKGSQDEEYLEIIYSESNRLASFVDQFLDLTRIESGSFPINLKEADITKTVKRVVKLYQRQAKNKNTRIKTVYGIPLLVLKYDTALIERAMGNYLSNAIKYSPEASTITVRTYLKDNCFHLEIADNGSGIAEKDLPRVFNKFYRVKEVDRKHEKGSGLGLAFVKQVIEKHNGRVYLTSRLNEGSVFGFKLPV